MMIDITRRSCVAAFLLLAAAGTAFAQPFPSKPITIVVPYAVGGTTDIVGRLISTQLGTCLVPGHYEAGMRGLVTVGQRS